MIIQLVSFASCLVNFKFYLTIWSELRSELDISLKTPHMISRDQIRHACITGEAVRRSSHCATSPSLQGIMRHACGFNYFHVTSMHHSKRAQKIRARHSLFSGPNRIACDYRWQNWGAHAKNVGRACMRIKRHLHASLTVHVARDVTQQNKRVCVNYLEPCYWKKKIGYVIFHNVNCCHTIIAHALSSFK